jgi:hypothetical protein
MAKRVAYVFGIGLLCAAIAFVLSQIESSDDDALFHTGFFRPSVTLSALLFVTLTLLFRKESLASAFGFTTVATVILPALATFVDLVPRYGVLGSFACLPVLSAPVVTFLGLELLLNLTIVFILYCVLADVVGP